MTETRTARKSFDTVFEHIILGGRMLITETEQAARRRAVDDARHNTELEGGSSSERVRTAQEEYVRGEIDLAELLDRSRPQ